MSLQQPLSGAAAEQPGTLGRTAGVFTLTGRKPNFFARTPAPTDRILSPSQSVVTSGNSTPVDCIQAKS